MRCRAPGRPSVTGVVSFAHAALPPRRPAAVAGRARRHRRPRRLGGRRVGRHQRRRRARGAGDAPIATFDADQLFDYRSRRPTLEIRDGRPRSLAWPELVLRHARLRRAGPADPLGRRAGRPLACPRRRGRGAAAAARRARLDQPGRDPGGGARTRVPVPILGTESSPGLLRGGVTPARPGCCGCRRRPSRCSRWRSRRRGSRPSGYFAQIPHYVTGAVRDGRRGPAARGGAAPGRGAAARRPVRRGAGAAARAWTRPRRPTRRRAPTWGGWRRWWTSHASPRATT